MYEEICGYRLCVLDRKQKKATGTKDDDFIPESDADPSDTD